MDQSKCTSDKTQEIRNPRFRRRWWFAFPTLIPDAEISRATFGARKHARLALREWQINCEPRVDGLIRLSRRYKRLSRSNSILRFWLSHPTDPRPVSLSPRRASVRRHPCLPACPSCVSPCSRLQPPPSPKRFLSPSPPPFPLATRADKIANDELSKTAYRILSPVSLVSADRVARDKNQWVESMCKSSETRGDLKSLGWDKR